MPGNRRDHEDVVVLDLNWACFAVGADFEPLGGGKKKKKKKRLSQHLRLPSAVKVQAATLNPKP